MMIHYLQGDCRDVLKTLPDNSIHCVVTSPPYWGLRDYGCSGQIGLEPTPDEYVAQMTAIFREVRRVLRDDGVCFLNLGDSHAMSTKGSSGVGKNATNKGTLLTDRSWQVPDNLKPKDLCGIPWRVAFALQADGWYLRSEITWCKKAPMPESVTDRPTNATEKVFLLTKSARYFYDNEAVREESNESSGWARQRSNGENTWKYNDTESRIAQTGQRIESSTYGTIGKRNIRNFWLLGPDPYPGAHFATMPRRIPEIAIMAGTSEKGCCSDCGAPYQRIVEKGLTAHDGQTQTIYPKGTTSNRLALLRQAARERGEEYRNESRTTGWQPACACNAPAIPCTVLDPFGGSGTTAMVAEQLGRDAILIELNPDYIALQRQRTAQPGFSFLEAA
jgi:DNA modification methylase